MVRILSNNGGSKNLDAFITATQNLKNKDQTWQTLAISTEDVVRILSNNGGSKNLDAFISATQNLKNQGQAWQTLGISIEDVVRILSHGGGSKNLDAFITATQNLKNKDQTWQTLAISTEDVVRILSHGGGSKNLDAFISATQNLKNQGQAWQTLGISIEDVVRILSNNGGHIKLQKVFQYSSLLFNLGFSIKDIIKAVLLPVKHFSIMVEFVRYLSKKFTPQEIVVLCKNKGFKKNIHDILSQITSNHAFNFTEEEIIVLNNIFSLDIDQISPSSSNNMYIAESQIGTEETNYDTAFSALLELFKDDSYPDDEFDTILDELIADENGITTHPYSTPLLHNSVFNTNNKKRPHQASSSTQRKSQRNNPDDDGLIDLINELIDDDSESNYLSV